MKFSMFAVFCALSVIAPSLPACAEDWGSIKGRFIYDGKAPKPKEHSAEIYSSKLAGITAQDESLVVDKDSNLANVVIYLAPKKNHNTEVHPDYQKVNQGKVEIEIKNVRFEPHVMLLQTSQALVIENADPVSHNAWFHLPSGESNQMVGSGSKIERQFKKAQAVPEPIESMSTGIFSGWVLVSGSPYMAVSAKDGTFEIKNLPAGEHEFILWHEKRGYLRDLKIREKATGKRGRIKLTIEKGKTLDLGRINVSPKMLHMDKKSIAEQRKAIDFNKPAVHH